MDEVVYYPCPFIVQIKLMGCWVDRKRVRSEQEGRYEVDRLIGSDPQGDYRLVRRS